MKVLKFGGTSVGSVDRIQAVLDIIQSRAVTKQGMAIVFSAFAKITDKLIELGSRAAQGDESYKTIFKEIESFHLISADRLISLKGRSQILTRIKLLLKDLEEVVYGVFLVKELTVKTLDYIMSFGERLSASIISECLADRNVKNEFVDSRKLIKTNNLFGQALVNFELTVPNILKRLNAQADIYIITGFIASTLKNETITLGRGGSDYSASIFGAALDADEVEIWTDVDGVLTADPRKVQAAFPIPRLSYVEAMELAHFGANVIHPPTMQPVMDKKIPLRIRNTFNPNFKGTVIGPGSGPNGYTIRGISSLDNVALLQIQGSGMIGISGIAQRIFSALARENINIILISQASSEHSICLAILPEGAVRAKAALEDELKYEINYGHVNEVAIEYEMAIIAVVGERMRHTKGIAGRVFQTLARNEVNISAIAQGSSELNISLVVSSSDETRALNALHQAFFKNRTDKIDLILVGTGVVGSALLEQLAYKKPGAEKYQLSGIANSKKMILGPQVQSASNWMEALENSDQNTDLSKITEYLKSSNSVRSLFVDCTTNANIAAHYPDLLAEGISIVSANKIANSGSQISYDQLKRLTGEKKTKFVYETNVGAGLPMLSTIRKLIAGGDRIRRLEGVLSGSLSYIFNTYNGSLPFSEVVRSAAEKGFTEADPRQDLSGADVVRKLLILIRESGRAFELEQIIQEPFLPDPVQKTASLEDFQAALQKSDDYFKGLWQEAHAQNKVLRFVARFDQGKAIVGLTAVDQDHPFYHLQGSDNILAIYTRHYGVQPLVIKGAGAGARVTAAGVLTDILEVCEQLSSVI